jgi:RNA recognition motif-containing protein
MPAQLFSELRAPSPAVSQALIVFAFPLREPTASFAQSGGPVPRVYVGNLAESVTRDDLRALFSKIGRVAGALVITDKLTGKSRGFGFVEMVEVEDAINAAVYFSGTELEGRKIHVDPFRPQEPGAQKFRGERKRRAPAKRSTSNGTA